MRNHNEKLAVVQKQIEEKDDFSEQNIGDYSYKKETVKRANAYTKANFASTFVGNEPHSKWTNMKDFNTDCKEHHATTSTRFVYKKLSEEELHKRSKVKPDPDDNNSSSSTLKRTRTINPYRDGRKKSRK